MVIADRTSAAAANAPLEVEVLLATWNGAEHLEAQVDSIHSQSLRPIRVLVRDDGSTDGTAELLEDLASRWPDWLILLPSGPRLGSSGNFAALMMASTAPYLALADQDDLWDHNKLALSMEAMRNLEERHPSRIPLLVHSDLRLISGNGLPLAQSFLEHQHINPHRCSSDALVLQNVVTGCACLFNRALLEQALPLPDAAVQHDHWLALVAARSGAIGFIPHPLLSYRQHGGNAIGASGSGWLYLFNRILHLGRRNGPMERLQAALAQAEALQKRFPGEEIALVRFAQAGAMRRCWLLFDGKLRKHGWRRQLGLLLLLPNLRSRRAIASID